MIKITKLFLLAALISISTGALGQNTTSFRTDQEVAPIKVRPFRLGVKIGVPNLLGGNLEYVTPLLGKKLSVTVDYSKIASSLFAPESDEESGDSENIDFDFSYFEAGLNYYFFQPGRGLYGGVSYGIITLKGTDTGIIVGGEMETAYMDFSHNSFNVKLGAKLGGLFYFRPEIGYSFNPLPKDIEYEVEYMDGTRGTDILPRDGVPEILYKGLIANIGLGFAF